MKKANNCESYGDVIKPSAHEFALCTAGRLLIVSLGLPTKTELSRAICLRMNELAMTIAEERCPMEVERVCQ